MKLIESKAGHVPQEEDFEEIYKNGLI